MSELTDWMIRQRRLVSGKADGLLLQSDARMSEIKWTADAEGQDLGWHALNYRTAHTVHAQAMYEEMERYLAEQVRQLLAAERERLWTEVRSALVGELDHAAVNGTRLPPAFGRVKGDDAVRAGNIMAVVERFDAAIPKSRQP